MTTGKPIIYRKRPGMWVFASNGRLARGRRATFPSWSAALAYAGRQRKP